MILIYRIEDSWPVGVATDSAAIDYEIKRSVIPSFGGIESDYSYIELPDDEYAKTRLHEFTIQNGEIIFGEEKVIEEPPKELSEVEKLRIEQAQANAELFEMMLMLTGGAV
jgi:hypothetical protein